MRSCYHSFLSALNIHCTFVSTLIATITQCFAIVIYLFSVRACMRFLCFIFTAGLACITHIVTCLLCFIYSSLPLSFKNLFINGPVPSSHSTHRIIPAAYSVLVQSLAIHIINKKKPISNARHIYIVTCLLCLIIYSSLLYYSILYTFLI